MVPASTLMYGSIFRSVTRKPRASSNDPIEAAASPLPSDDTTPPVTKMNFGPTSSLLSGLDPLSNILRFASTVPDFAVETGIAQPVEHGRHCGPARNAERDDVVAAQHRPDVAGAGELVDGRPDHGISGDGEPRPFGGAATAEQSRA